MSSSATPGTLPLVAGVPVLDLVNTVSWRGSAGRRHEHLRTADDCVTWAAHAGVVDAAEAERLRALLAGRPGLADGVVEGLHALRDAVADAVLASGEQVPGRAREVIVEALGAGVLVRAAREQDAGHEWRVPAVDEHVVRRRLAVELHSLLLSPARRIGVCADEECSWVFLDVSRGQNRLWCRSSDCGNRNRVRRHASRRRATTD